jgi:hypothetical protein
MAFLLDTNVLSELRRSRPDPAVVAWFDRTPSSELFLSVLVLGEVQRGIDLLAGREPRRATALSGWLGDLADAHADRLLAVTREVALAWGRLAATRPLPVVDGLLLATAEVHGLALVTREAARLADAGVPVLDPWRR